MKTDANIRVDVENELRNVIEVRPEVQATDVKQKIQSAFQRQASLDAKDIKVNVDHLLISAKQYGIRQLYAVELADNQAMRNFAKDVGMAAERDPSDANQVIYSLGL